MVVMRETLIFAVYYAPPRGRIRLYRLGRELAERHLLPPELLVGIIGAEGAGKSTLIRGIFPGLELTNDDEGVNPSLQLITHEYTWQCLIPLSFADGRARLRSTPW
jgi:hypothetical protein